MKYKILITGPSGGMGKESLRQMIEDLDLYELTIFCLDNDKERESIRPFVEKYNLATFYGDLQNYDLVKKVVSEQDLIVHIAAFVSPAADYYPKKAMEINYGSIRNIILSIKELGQEKKTKVVGIGTVAETGDRMPPIHWGRVGDPIKPSMFDYYAVSKVAAERLLIESEIDNWVSLRQTGIMGPHMAKTDDAIMFHNCLNNVLEYVSDRDSGKLIKNLCKYEATKQLPDHFWNNIYNIGGGEKCRVSALEMYKVIYGKMGIKNLESIIKPKMYATRNFHGQYYLDSDILNDFLNFRTDSIDYFYEAFLDNMGSQVAASN